MLKSFDRVSCILKYQIMKKLISISNPIFFLALFLILVGTYSCKKENEIGNKQNNKVTLKDFNPKTSLTASEYDKYLKEESRLMPDTLTQEDTKKSESLLTRTVLTNGVPQPGVAFNTSWNSTHFNYNCSSYLYGSTLARIPSGSYIYIGTDTMFKTYWSNSQNGTYTGGNLNTKWQIRDLDVTFNINNPPSTGRYYFIRCTWRNVYYSDYFGFYVELYSLDSQLKYLGHHNLPPPFPVLSVTIAGPVKGFNNLQYTWHAIPENGSGTITYQWYYSSDGGQTYPYSWGAGQYRTDYLTNGQDLYLKVVATASNGTVSDTFMTLNLGNNIK